MPEFNVAIVVFGFVGGIVPDLLRFIRNRFDLNTEAYLKSLKYWLSLLFLALLGAFAAWIFGAQDEKAALVYGFTAPEIITRLASGQPVSPVMKGVVMLNPKQDPGKLSLRDWWNT
jgi:purine-cytosine permease-like protein